MSPDNDDPVPSITSSVLDALQLGCVAIGFTIYPGSMHFKSMYEEISVLAREATQHGMAVVIWAYPRGSGISKEGETAVDVVSYAAHIAAQLGAHIIKVKLPTEHVEFEASQKKYQEHRVALNSVSDRVRHVVQSTFNGKRIVIFSGGSKVGENEFYEDIRGIHAGGGFGSIIGRNSFQRPKDDGLKLLKNVMEIYSVRG
jgi:fructose-bisphosphate aldolase, class I